MTEDGKVHYESVFRESWRTRQGGGARAGELVRQPGWIDAALVALGIALCAGAVAAGTISVSQSVALPAVVDGTSVTAVRHDADAPTRGTAVLFRDAAGRTTQGVMDRVSDTEIVARLDHELSAQAGQLVIPTGRQPIIDVLLPSLG